VSLSKRPSHKDDGPPTWLVFLLGIAVVFGMYYLWLGARDFFQSGGLGISEATERAEIISTATAERVQQLSVPSSTPRPSNTPIPECLDFAVSVPNAIVREAPNTTAPIATSLFEGTIVCVIGREPDSEWYLIDSNPKTRRLNPAYMHETVIEAVNPTLTPTETFTPLPSVTPAPTLSPTISPSPAPTVTRDPQITETPTPSFTPSPTEPLQSI
jgi:hypothetical protein